MKRSIMVAAIVAASTMLATSGHTADFKWTSFGNLPLTHVYAKMMAAGFKRIEERSKGQLQIRYVFYGETPYKNTESTNLLRDNLTQMSEWSPSLLAANFPALGGMELPFIVPKTATAAEGQAAAERAWKTPIMSGMLKKIMGDNHFRLLARYYYQPMNFWFVSKEPGLAAFKGKKVRTFNSEYATLVTELGASPVSLTSPEVYNALQRNLLDGVITGSANLPGTKWDEVLNSGYIVNMSYAATFLAVSQKAYDSLPPDLQKILTEETQKTNDELLAFMPKSDVEAQDTLKKRGFVFAQPTEQDYKRLHDVAESKVWPAWEKKVGADAPKLLSEIKNAMK